MIAHILNFLSVLWIFFFITFYFSCGQNRLFRIQCWQSLIWSAWSFSQSKRPFLLPFQPLLLAFFYPLWRSFSFRCTSSFPPAPDSSESVSVCSSSDASAGHRRQGSDVEPPSSPSISSIEVLNERTNGAGVESEGEHLWHRRFGPPKHLFKKFWDERGLAFALWIHFLIVEWIAYV